MAERRGRKNVCVWHSNVTLGVTELRSFTKDLVKGKWHLVEIIVTLVTEGLLSPFLCRPNACHKFKYQGLLYCGWIQSTLGMSIIERTIWHTLLQWFYGSNISKSSLYNYLFPKVDRLFCILGPRGGQVPEEDIKGFVLEIQAADMQFCRRRGWWYTETEPYF